MNMPDANNLGQPIGPALPGWQPPPRPPRAPMMGRYCRVELIDPARHAEDRHRANALDPSKRNFTYLTVGPFDTFDAYREWMASATQSEDPLFHAIVDTETGKAAGIASFMRIDAKNGVIEVG